MLRVLIADDHAVVRSGLHHILQGLPDCEVVAEADNGKDAISKALATKPDIAVLDFSLPLIDGLEATRQIRMRLPKTEILIFTMHDSEMLIDDVLKAGARGYLQKTDAGENLIAAIRALAAHKPFFTSKVSETLLDSYLSRASARTSPLTDRERSVVKLIAEGNTNRQVGDILNISLKTVETHRASIMRKLKLNSSAALVRYAIRNKLVEV
jgi:DNA-binding NarL/FixJ family response regulator